MFLNNSVVEPPESAQTKIKKSYAGTAELFLVEKYLTNYNRDLVRKIVNFHRDAKLVLEFGAGLGTLANAWRRKTGISPVCLEVDPELQKIIQDRGFDCYDDITSVEGEYDLIYSSNVLEHIKDDIGAIKGLYSKIKNGGSLVLYVPAFQMLYSSMDEKIGHYRRYEKNEIVEKVTDAGFDVVSAKYCDSIGFFAWFLSGKIGGTENQGSSMQLYDKFIFPLSKFFDRIGLERLFGKNILVYARKSKFHCC